jgi:hypothetical protein
VWTEWPDTGEDTVDKLTRVLLVAVLLAGCGRTAATPSEVSGHTITGRFILNSRSVDRNADLTRCEGTGGFSDIEQGTPVTLRDGDGNVTGTARLEVASREAFGNFPGCVYAFIFEDVADADFYALEIADRGELAYSRAELEAADWNIRAELGD